MNPRSYCVGLPVILTVHDDGRVQVEVDMSEASSEMSEQWGQDPDGEDVPPEDLMLLDSAVVDAQTREHVVAADMPASWIEGAELKCPVQYSCPVTFAAGETDLMGTHIRDGHA